MGLGGNIGKGFDMNFVQNDPIFGGRERPESQLGDEADGIRGGEIEMERSAAAGVVEAPQHQISRFRAREAARPAIGRIHFG